MHGLAHVSLCVERHSGFLYGPSLTEYAVIGVQLTLAFQVVVAMATALGDKSDDGKLARVLVFAVTTCLWSLFIIPFKPYRSTFLNGFNLSKHALELTIVCIRFFAEDIPDSWRGWISKSVLFSIIIAICCVIGPPLILAAQTFKHFTQRCIFSACSGVNNLQDFYFG